LVENVPMTVKPDKSVPNEDGTDEVKGYVTEQAVQDFIVNALGLLDKKGMPKPVADFLLSARKDTFLPYKGEPQIPLDAEGNVSRNEPPEYDLIANQKRSLAVIEQAGFLGKDEVVGSNPLSLDDVMAINKKVKSGAPTEVPIEDENYGQIGVSPDKPLLEPSRAVAAAI